MANCHTVECAVAIGLTRVPVQFFPVITENLPHRVAWWQGYTNAEAPFDASRCRIDEIMLVAIIHGAEVYRIVSYGHLDLSRLHGQTSRTRSFAPQLSTREPVYSVACRAGIPNIVLLIDRSY